MRTERHPCSLFVALLAIGCGGSDPPLTGDSGVDAGPSDAGPTDGGGDPDAGEPTCRPGDPFELAPALASTQIHADLAFDGEATWLVFNVPEEGGTGLFDVYAMRLGCDGSIVTPPFVVNTTRAPNDVDPSIAISEERVLVAWHSDDSTLESNLDIRYRIFVRDGTPLLDEDRVLETTRGGTPVSGNALAPQVTPRSAGGFWIAGMRGIEEAAAFQVFAQAIASDGSLDGDALDWIDPASTQSEPTIAEDADGLNVAWTRTDAFTERTWILRSDRDAPEELWPADPSAAPALAAEGTRRYAAVQASITMSEQEIFLALVEPPARLGRNGRLDFSPRVVLTGGGGVVAWYRNVAGLENELVMQPFTDAGGAVTLGEEIIVSGDRPAAPYPPAVTEIADGLGLVVWSSGTSPDLRLYGRFVAVP